MVWEPKNRVLRKIAGVPPMSPPSSAHSVIRSGQKILIAGEVGVWACIAGALILIPSSHLPIIRYFTRVYIGRITRGYLIQKR